MGCEVSFMNRVQDYQIFKKEKKMKVKDIMTRNVKVVESDSTIQEVAEIMKELEVRDLPVIMGKDIVGIITDRDIVVKVVANRMIPKEAKVVEGMTKGLYVCAEDDNIELAAKLMVKNEVRYLLVMNRYKSLAGIVSLEDMALNLEPRTASEILGEMSF
jgi:CBS domain-containing protein